MRDDQTKRRIKIVRNVVIGIFIILALRLAYLMLF